MTGFNVIIGFFDGSGTSMVPSGRIYLNDAVKQAFQGQTPAAGALRAHCMSIPAVFSDEITSTTVPMARIGWITGISQAGRDVRVTYQLPSGVAPVPADKLADAVGLSNPARGIGDMQHSHWRILDGDLLQTLMNTGALEAAQPSVFQPVLDGTQPNLVSVMMPFDPGMSGVYSAIEAACTPLRADCRRADNIWEHSTVIQDIYSLIHKSAVVVCDFSNKNPNVFYEAGIAHTLGRDVIPIVQHPSDIPFDLQHHRYIQYLNNAEGLAKLTVDITARLQTLLERR